MKDKEKKSNDSENLKYTSEKLLHEKLQKAATSLQSELTQNEWKANPERWDLKIDNLWKGRFSLMSHNNKTEFTYVEKWVTDIWRSRLKWDKDEDLESTFYYEIDIPAGITRSKLLCKDEADVLKAVNLINLVKNIVNNDWKKLRLKDDKWFNEWPFFDVYDNTSVNKSIKYFTRWIFNSEKTLLSWSKNFMQWWWISNYNFNLVDYSDWNPGWIASQPRDMNSILPYFNFLFSKRLEIEKRKDLVRADTWRYLADIKPK